MSTTPFLGMARQVRLVGLDHVGIDVGHLFRQHVADGVRELLGVAIAPVVQHLGGHVPSGEGEAIELAVAHEVDAGVRLAVYDDARGVHQRFQTILPAQENMADVSTEWLA